MLHLTSGVRLVVLEARPVDDDDGALLVLAAQGAPAVVLGLDLAIASDEDSTARAHGTVALKQRVLELEADGLTDEDSAAEPRAVVLHARTGRESGLRRRGPTYIEIPE